MKKLPELKFTYHYIEPKTPEEKEEAERRLQAVYKILFDITLESEGWRRYKATHKDEKLD